MIPGVTYLPAPSITSASAGASTVAPTPAIFPFCMRIAPFLISGPAAVRMLTFRITVGREAKGAYVLGNGSAFGVDIDPRPPSAVAESRAGVVVVVVRARADAQARTAASWKPRKARMCRIF